MLLEFYWFSNEIPVSECSLKTVFCTKLNHPHAQAAQEDHCYSWWIWSHCITAVSSVFSLVDFTTSSWILRCLIIITQGQMPVLTMLMMVTQSSTIMQFCFHVDDPVVHSSQVRLEIMSLWQDQDLNTGVWRHEIPVRDTQLFNLFIMSCLCNIVCKHNRTKEKSV